jgi:hypothetical protein
MFWTPRALKILVSVVRFRPGHQYLNNALLMRGIFFSSLAGFDAIGLGYPHQEPSFKRTHQLFIPASVDVV